MDEQSQQEDLEEKLKEYVDCLTDKRYPGCPPALLPCPCSAPGRCGPGRAGPQDTLLHPPVPRPGKVLLRTCAWPWRPACSPTSCWSAASHWPMPWKSASRKVGCGARGDPKWPGADPGAWLTGRVPAGKGEEQALAAALLGLLCVQLGPGPKSEELFHGLQPLLVSVLTDATASPSARLHVSAVPRDTLPSPAPRREVAPPASRPPAPRPSPRLGTRAHS